MQVENVTWVCFTPWWSAEKQGKCTISSGMLGQVIINNEDILALLHPLFTNCTTRIWCDVLQWCKFGCCCCNNNCIIHGSEGFQCVYNRRYCRLFLTNCNIDTKDILSFLIDNRIKSNGCLTSLSVTDNQLTLTTANRDHGVNRLNSCL